MNILQFGITSWGSGLPCRPYRGEGPPGYGRCRRPGGCSPGRR